MSDNLIAKKAFAKNLETLVKDASFEDAIFFIYTDGEGWGQEIYGKEAKDEEEARIALMWWNIAINHVHRIKSKVYIKFSFGFTFRNYIHSDLNDKYKFSPIEKFNEISENLTKAHLTSV